MNFAFSDNLKVTRNLDIILAQAILLSISFLEIPFHST
jgi:hypothetical protein